MPNEDHRGGIAFMENIKFSVLIPVYNAEKYLSECIESVLDQTYHNFEIILVDDGSTDSSGKICDLYEKKDERIKVYHQNNQGLIMARRKAIDKSSGDFYLFLDSDDYWDADLLETINGVISAENCDLVIFRFKIVNETGKFIEESPSLFANGQVFTQNNKNEIFKKFICGELNNLCNKAAKFSIIDRDRDYFPYKHILNAEDLLQSLPIVYNAQRIVYLDKPLYNYRMVSTSITHSLNLNYINDNTVARNALLKYMELLKINNKENLVSFYKYNIMLFSQHIARVILSNINWKRKVQILNSLKKEQNYIETISFLRSNKRYLSLKYKIFLNLFERKHYKTIYLSLNFKKLIKGFFKT